MAKLVNVTYGYVEAVSTADGNQYPSDDFRSNYYNTCDRKPLISMTGMNGAPHDLP